MRRFNALFRERYRLIPSDLRRARASALPAEALRCTLAYRPPLDWDALLAFLGARAFGGVEAWDGSRYLRTVAIGDHRGWIAAASSPERDALHVEVSASLAPILPATLARVKRLFDLGAHPGEIAAHLGLLAAAHPGLRVPGAFDGFEVAVRAILGQQVSVKAATTLAGRLSEAFGKAIVTPWAALTRLPPTAERLARAEPKELTALGILPTRANSILALAGAVAAGSLRLEPGGDVPQTMAQLQKLPGVGAWTAQYVAMRALAWPDAFPHTDLGIVKALGEANPKRALAAAEAWRPWRSYAAMHLWKSLEETR